MGKWSFGALCGSCLAMLHVWVSECCCCVESVDLLSFSAWLEGEEDPVIERVNQRIEDITGLTTQTAELLQVHTTYYIGLYMHSTC